MRLHTKEDGLLVAHAWDGGFDEECDVMVIGLGTAGPLAAIAAGREGCKVIGIEGNTYMGGVGTGGGIHVYCCGRKGGIQDEVDKRVDEVGKAYSPVRGFHPDAKKLVLEQMCREAGVEPRYRTRITGIFREGNKVVGVRTSGPDGEKSIGTRVVIDCSGDADACTLAGCEIRLGREFDGQPQPYSMPRGFINQKGGVDGANFDAGYVDPSDAVDYSEAICKGHTLHLMERYEEEDRILYLASTPGLREGRFVVGEETLLAEDFFYERPVKRKIAEAFSFHDNHSKDWAFESDFAQDWVTVCGFWGRRLIIEVPYGVTVPKDMEGILVAGRCISLDHDSAQSFRMQRDMQTLGEATGVAASIAIADSCALKDVPYEKLKAKLVATDCLPAEPTEREPWLTETDEIKKKLSSTAPGPGIWSARLKGDAIVGQLQEWLAQKEDRNLRINSAFALSLLGKQDGLPLLRELVVLRDATKPTGRVHNTQQRDHAAMQLLGRFADREILPVLLYAVTGPTERLQDFTQALVSVLRIGRAHEDLRERIVETLTARLQREDFDPVLKLQKSTPKGSVIEEGLNSYIRLVISREFRKWGAPVDAIMPDAEAKLTFRDKRILDAMPQPSASPTRGAPEVAKR